MQNQQYPQYPQQQYQQPQYPQQPPKKTNWTMIILILILIPILILGGIFGYKMITKDDAANNTALSQNGNPAASGNNQPNASFPLTGDWYYKDNGAVLKYINEKYTFSAPQNVNGVQQGQVTITIEWMGVLKTLNYEVINDGKMKISHPANEQAPYEMEYAYNATSQTLEVSDQGHRLTYVRTPQQYNNNTTAPATAAASTPAQQQPKEDLSQLPPVGFDQPKTPGNFRVQGAWSNAQGPGSDRYVMSLTNIQQNGSKIKGEIDCQFFDKSGSHTGDALWYFSGTINGNVADINVTDLKGNTETRGTLTLSGGTLKFAMNKQAGLLPKNASLREH